MGHCNIWLSVGSIVTPCFDNFIKSNNSLRDIEGNILPEIKAEFISVVSGRSTGICVVQIIFIDSGLVLKRS